MAISESLRRRLEAINNEFEAKPPPQIRRWPAQKPMQEMIGRMDAVERGIREHKEAMQQRRWPAMNPAQATLVYRPPTARPPTARPPTARRGPPPLFGAKPSAAPFRVAPFGGVPTAPPSPVPFGGVPTAPPSPVLFGVPTAPPSPVPFGGVPTAPPSPVLFGDRVSPPRYGRR